MKIATFDLGYLVVLLIRGKVYRVRLPFPLRLDSLRYLVRRLVNPG